MYQFDKEDLKAMQKRLNKKNMDFNDYIPNSMQVRRPGSKQNLAETVVNPNS
jgi:signal recognition particle GTPase